MMFLSYFGNEAGFEVQQEKSLFFMTKLGFNFLPLHLF
jgi:hypothetical protein